MKTLYILMVGCGDFGFRAYAALREVLAGWHCGGWQIRWLGVVEVSGRRREQIEPQLTRDGVPLFQDLEGALRALPSTGEHLFVHDVADNIGRLDRVARIVGQYPRAFFLAEKPLIISANQWPEANRLAARCPRFTVDFPENTMSVTRAAVRILQDFTIHEITCFQCNSIGEEKLTNPGTRPSVMGGSLFDKAPHPVAWCHEVLSPSEARVISARATRLMAYCLPERGVYLDQTGNPTTSVTEAADAQMEICLQFTRRREPGRAAVPVTIVSSWRGVPSNIQAYVTTLHIPAELVLDETCTTTSTSFRNQEARLKILHGTYEDQPATMVVSTLPRAAHGIPPQAWLTRSAVLVYRPAAGSLDGIGTPPRASMWDRIEPAPGPDSLAFVYENCLDVAAGRTKPLLSARDGVEIHRLLLDAERMADRWGIAQVAA